VDNDVRIFPGEPLDDNGHKTGRHGDRTSDPDFAGMRVCKKLDMLDALSELVKCGQAALEECVAIGRGLDTLGAAVEYAHPERYSKSEIAFDMTGTEIASPWAALVMLPDCTTAMSTCRSRNLMRRPMRSAHCILTS
jgi:hypothetical protein